MRNISENLKACDFQVECDVEVDSGVIDMLRISIHALIKDATTKLLNQLLKITYFNPRTHKGCDSNVELGKSEDVIFQSTHPYDVYLEGVGVGVTRVV